MVEYVSSPLLITVHDDFSVALRAENMASRLQFAFQFRKVVDLSVEDHPDGLILIGHRLMYASKINDRQTAKTQSKRAIEVESFVVRTTVNDRCSHSPDHFWFHRTLAAKIILSANSAHDQATRFAARDSR